MTTRKVFKSEEGLFTILNFLEFKMNRMQAAHTIGCLTLEKPKVTSSGTFTIHTPTN